MAQVQPWTHKAIELAPAVLKHLLIWAPSGVALSRDTLCNRVGCSDRVLRAAVVELRRQGHLVIADGSGGYRLARNADEVAAYTASLKSRVRALREIIDVMEGAAEQRFCQLGQMERL